jgi:hypothetical protein
VQIPLQCPGIGLPHTQLLAPAVSAASTVGITRASAGIDGAVRTSTLARRAKICASALDVARAPIAIAINNRIIIGLLLSRPWPEMIHDTPCVNKCRRESGGMCRNEAH